MFAGLISPAVLVGYDVPFFLCPMECIALFWKQFFAPSLRGVFLC